MRGGAAGSADVSGTALSGVLTGSMAQRNSLSSYRFVAVMIAQFIIQVLLLPLVLLVLSLRVPGFWEPGPSDGRISPVLEFEARMRLDTYRRDCGSSSPA
mgnify:CR=1 FL=1